MDKVYSTELHVLSPKKDASALQTHFPGAGKQAIELFIITKVVERPVLSTYSSSLGTSHIMSDWQSPKYAPNSDVEPDTVTTRTPSDDDDVTSGYGTPAQEAQPSADPWNDPDDEEEEDGDPVAGLKELSPDYLGMERPGGEGRKQGSAAWDALGDDDDETDDEIPAGITIGGRETKNAAGTDGGLVDGAVNGFGQDHDEASRKRQRESEDAQNKRQRLENGTGQPSDDQTPDNPQPNHPASANPPTSSLPANTSLSRTQQSHNRPPHHPMPGLIMPSFFGITPRDDFVRIIGEWLLRVCAGRPGIEVSSEVANVKERRLMEGDRLRSSWGLWWIQGRGSGLVCLVYRR